MKALKIILVGLLAFIIILAAVFFYSIHTHVSISPYEKWYVQAPENIPDSSLYIQFVGFSTLVISDGNTHVMTDGFFTRPAALDLLFGEIEPNLPDIQFGLDKLEVDSLDGIFVVHSHFDHAMDAPEVAKRTGAVMYGSESTLNIGRGWNLPEGQMELFQNNQAIQIGQFTIMPILSNHYEFINDNVKEQALEGSQTIDEPLVPPAKALDYKMGGAYTLVFSHPKGDFVLQSSAGWKENSLDTLQSDIVLLGIGGLGAQTQVYQETYFDEIVDELEAQHIYLVHWDGFTGSIRKPIKASTLFTDWLMGNTIGSFQTVEREVAKRPGLKVNMLPQWEKIVLFD